MAGMAVVRQSKLRGLMVRITYKPAIDIQMTSCPLLFESSLCCFIRMLRLLALLMRLIFSQSSVQNHRLPTRRDILKP